MVDASLVDTITLQSTSTDLTLQTALSSNKNFVLDLEAAGSDQFVSLTASGNSAAYGLVSEYGIFGRNGLTGVGTATCPAVNGKNLALTLIYH